MFFNKSFYIQYLEVNKLLPLLILRTAAMRRTAMSGCRINVAITRLDKCCQGNFEHERACFDEFNSFKRNCDCGLFWAQVHHQMWVFAKNC